MNPMGFVFIAGGFFSVMAAASDWDWFMESRKGRVMCSLLGRTGARGFYMVIGTLLIVLGILLAVGLIEDTHR